MVLFFAACVLAVSGAETPPRPLVVATHVAPPFVMRSGDDWSGLSSDLRKAVNLSLLGYIHSDSWRRLEKGYLGRE